MYRIWKRVHNVLSDFVREARRRYMDELVFESQRLGLYDLEYDG